MRRDKREWPPRDRCFALESISRALSFMTSATSKRAARKRPATQEKSNAIFTDITRAPLQSDEDSLGTREDRATGGYQLPADEPHPAPVRNPVSRVVQPDRKSLRRARIHRAVAVVCRSGPRRFEAAAVRRPSCLLHARAQAGRAPRGPRPAPAREPVRRNYRGVRADRGDR